MPIVNKSTRRKYSHFPKHIPGSKLLVCTIGNLYRKEPENKYCRYCQHYSGNDIPAFRESIHLLYIFKKDELTGQNNHNRENTAEDSPK